MIRLSVIIPVYNTEKYLKRCIESVLNQSFCELEIILVDDGSTDSSGEICDGFALSNDHIHVFHKQNGGQTSARLCGLLRSSGKYISFVDSDDYIEPNMFSDLIGICEKYDCDLISSGTLYEVQDKRETIVFFDHYEEGHYTELQEKIYPTMVYDHKIHGHGLHSSLCNKIFKRSLLLDVFRRIDRKIFLGEDSAVLYRYCLCCHSIYILYRAYYHYCRRDDSISSVVSVKMMESSYCLYNSLKEAFIAHKCKNDLMRQLKCYIMDKEMHSLHTLFDINPGVFNKWEFHYPIEIFSKKYIIYGAGGCGQALFHYLRRKKLINQLVAWIDQRAELVQEECDFQIENIQNGLKKEFDFVVIAIRNREIAKKISFDLMNRYNVDNCKIVWEELFERPFISDALY